MYLDSRLQMYVGRFRVDPMGKPEFLNTLLSVPFNRSALYIGRAATLEAKALTEGDILGDYASEHAADGRANVYFNPEPIYNPQTSQLIIPNLPGGLNQHISRKQGTLRLHEYIRGSADLEFVFIPDGGSPTVIWAGGNYVGTLADPNFPIRLDLSKKPTDSFTLLLGASKSAAERGSDYLGELFPLSSIYLTITKEPLKF